MWKRKAELGTARVVCIVKESLDAEVAEFERAAWNGGEILLDEPMSWFAALGGGTVDKKSLAAWIGRVLMPFSQTAKNMQIGKNVDGNLIGEGMITGGCANSLAAPLSRCSRLNSHPVRLYVVNKGGEVAYTFREAEVGDMFDVDDVVKAVAKR